jgi:hypothetical protein
MILLVFFIQNFLASLFELALPLAVLVVQLLNVLLDLDGLGVVLRPVVILPLE